MLKRVIWVVAIAGIMSGSAMANFLPPGGVVAPDVFGAPSGSVVANTGTVKWSFTTATGTSSGTYDEVVVRDSAATAVCPTGGCLDFLLTVSNSSASHSAIERATLSGFSPAFVFTDVGYVAGAGKIPDFVNRPLPAGDTVGFNFIFTGIVPGATSQFLDIQTNATAFAPGNVSIIDSGTFTGTGFSAVTAPEPGTLTLLGSGLLGLAGLLRRKLVCA